MHIYGLWDEQESSIPIQLQFFVTKNKQVVDYCHFLLSYV